MWLNHDTNAVLSFKFLECQCKQLKMEFFSPRSFFSYILLSTLILYKRADYRFSGNFILHSFFVCVCFFLFQLLWVLHFEFKALPPAGWRHTKTAKYFNICHCVLCWKQKKKRTKSRMSCVVVVANKRATERSRLVWIPFSSRCKRLRRFYDFSARSQSGL